LPEKGDFERGVRRKYDTSAEMSGTEAELLTRTVM
jgi:hypothetical protein